MLNIILLDNRGHRIETDSSKTLLLFKPLKHSTNLTLNLLINPRQVKF